MTVTFRAAARSRAATRSPRSINRELLEPPSQARLDIHARHLWRRSPSPGTFPLGGWEPLRGLRERGSGRWSPFSR